MSDEEGALEGGMRIEADLVRQLAELLNQNDLTEIEVEDGNRKIVVKRSVVVAAAAPAAPAAAALSPANHPGVVKSPMVGTVFLAGEPGARPFVSAGEQVKEGDTLLIIEAMKVMNPIVAPRSGTVSQILVLNAQPVEYDQPLVILE
ncbi:MAG TPA: acetyl-CoA carboxylase biotin carboxyl carrier protein subunit [Allosphingosinicella sp.]|nr:acetyl-CoA carboxylase biotin carboxyl carrier protein subunit [Allosphingosinicella sp.]